MTEDQQDAVPDEEIPGAPSDGPSGDATEDEDADELEMLSGDEADEATLMDRLDRRQNQVLAELDQLNFRIERLVVDWQQQREQDRAA